MNTREQLILWSDKGYTIPDIVRLTGMKYDSVKSKYRYYGLPYNKVPSKWNSTRIMNINDDDGLYVIGLLAADGYIYRDKNIGLYLKHTDVELLHRVINVLGNPAAPISNRVNSCGSIQCGINVGSVEIVKYLQNVYGFTNTKSFTVPFPSHLSNPLPYLRGFFDGDGYMGAQPVITTASYPFLQGLLLWLIRTYNIRPRVSVHGANFTTFNITFRVYESSFIVDMMKYPGLMRKSNRLAEYLPKTTA